MEMKGSRRPFDGPRVEPGLKKARLAEDAAPDLSSSGRGFIQQRPVSSRFQHSDRGDAESSDSVRGPFPPQQHHELVRQYKAALAELTFNSKPIITNLTIIAGENSHAARGIAATICTHILEVSSEQKLPSLYLLDSIVKNIGRDYIKHFATRLPEVFCKAYRQVDPSIHHGMRHLFGTWKGVFPPQTLQLIEKDLGFTTGVNVSTSRTESQSSRPAHSIHVNPKYLEARQRMQQSTRTKGTVGEISETLKISGEGVESLNRTASVSFIPRRSWVDPSIKGELNEPVAEYGSTVSKHPDMGVGRMSGQVKEQVLDKRWHDFSSKSSGYDLKHEFQNYPSHKSASHDALNKSWKNSEEEEYMWDDITSRVPHATKSLVKDHWTLDDSGRMDLECQLQRSQIMKEIGLNFDSDTSTDSLSTENKRQASFGHQVSSSWSREPHSFDGGRHPDSARNISNHSEGYHNSFSGLSTAANSIGRTSFQPRTGTVPIGSSNNGLSLNAAPEYAGLIAKQREPRRTASPSSHSTMHQRSPSPSISTHSSSQITRKVGDRDQTHTISQVDPRTSQIPRSTLDPRQKFYQEYLPTLSRNAHLDISQRRVLQGRNNVSLPEPLASEPQEFESIHQAEKPVVSVIPGYTKPSVTQSSLSNASKHSGAESPGQASTSSLLAAVMRSGILSSDTLVGSLPGLNSQDSVSPPLPSCSSPTQPVDIPPNVPSSNVTNSASNPVSSLLSTLVAKGLITASKTQSPTAVESKIAPQIPIRSPPTVSKNSSVVSSVPASVSPSSSKAEELSKPATKTSDIPAKSATREIKNLIGLVFKPDVIRQPHPIVISELLDDIPHQCSMCGLRLKLKEQLDRHLDWHASRNPDMKLLNKAPRKWYSSSAEWVAGNGSFNKGSCKIMESSEPMVPADERQCICILCGEVFEDIFSEDSNRWMFKGAVYMSSQSLGDNCGSANKEGIALGPIVHKNCISETSLHDLGLVQDVKQEKDT